MDADLERFLERRFRIPETGREVVGALSEAVAEHVRAGDALHMGMTHTRFSAALWEVVRQFHGSAPGFELLGVAISSPHSVLVHEGLARRVVTSWAGDSYWTPGPNAIYGRAADAGLDFELWSILTFAQRLEAGARGHAWTTTSSLAGSDIAAALGPARYREIEPGLALIPALVPDVSIFHAPAADPYGNVLMTPPLMENVWGALGARRGAIVTVDRIVDAAFVREHNHLVRIPASAVLAVVEAPLGGHPGGMMPRGIAGAEPYGEDYEFWVDIRRAARDPGAMDAWIKEWVLDCESHDAYVRRLGDERITRLRRRAAEDGWRDVLAEAPPIDESQTYSALEMAIVQAGRELSALIAANGYSTVLAGAGMANLAAWLGGFALADEGSTVDIAAEMGLVGYWPAPGEPMLFNQRNFPRCTMVSDIGTTLGVLVGGAQARAIGSLGAAQVDRRGNINATRTAERFLMGSGGMNDVATCAAETLVVAAQMRDRFPERVDYVTAPGDRVRTVVTTLGVYRKDGDELVLTGVYGDDVEAGVREARAQCGWDLRVARDVATFAPPTHSELRTIRLMDPNGWFRA